MAWFGCLLCWGLLNLIYFQLIDSSVIILSRNNCDMSVCKTQYKYDGKYDYIF